MEKTKNYFYKYKTSLILFFLTYFFLIFLNVHFPTQSDDLGYKISGIRAAINSFMNWNGRLGELFRVSFGGWFATTQLFSFCNALAGTILLFTIYFVFYQKVPESKEEIIAFCIMLLFYLVDPVFAFGSMFYWAAGSYNYLYSWLWIFLWLIPYVSFWKKNDISKKKSIQVISIISGFLAGWSTEFCIVFIVLCLVSIIYSIIKKIKLPLWYYFALITICIGWIILYTCPGTNKRAADSTAYLSLIEILKLGPIGIYNRLNACFIITRASLFYENFLLVSIFIGLTIIFPKPTLRKLLIGLTNIIIMLIPLRIIPKLYFIPITIIICIYYIIKQKELAKYYLLIVCVLIVEFLFIGATIQISIPRRASFQYTLLNTVLICLNMLYFFKYIKQIKLIYNIIYIISLVITILFAFFVMTDSVVMNKKWKKMEQSIELQKDKNIKNVIIDKNTFISHYWSYGDWGNPTEDINDWVNLSYSDYYGVETISVQ